jgi:ABC-type phosphate transport system ATPase subunit
MKDDRPISAPVSHASGRHDEPLVSVRDLNLWYGPKQALTGVNFDLYPNEILSFIGPSG